MNGRENTLPVDVTGTGLVAPTIISKLHVGDVIVPAFQFRDRICLHHAGMVKIILQGQVFVSSLRNRLDNQLRRGDEKTLDITIVQGFNKGLGANGLKF